MTPTTEVASVAAIRQQIATTTTAAVLGELAHLPGFTAWWETLPPSSRDAVVGTITRRVRAAMSDTLNAGALYFEQP